MVQASKTQKMVKMVTPRPDCESLGHICAHDETIHIPTPCINYVYDTVSSSFNFGEFGSKHMRVCFPNRQYNWPKYGGFVQVTMANVVLLTRTVLQMANKAVQFYSRLLLRDYNLA